MCYDVLHVQVLQVRVRIQHHTRKIQVHNEVVGGERAQIIPNLQITVRMVMRT